MFDWIFFDLDDTLRDHRSASRRAMKLVCERWELPFEQLFDLVHEHNQVLWKQLAAGETDVAWQRLGRFALSLPKIQGGEKLDAEEISEFYLREYIARPSFVPGVEETLRAAAKRARLAVLSNAPHDVQDRKLAHLNGLEDCFDFVVFMDDANVLKPDPYFYRLARERAGDPAPNRILMVGDSWSDDVEAPLANGWRAAWISHGREKPEPDPRALIFEDLAAFGKWVSSTT